MANIGEDLPPISSKSLKKINTLLIGLKKEDGSPLVTSDEANNLANLKLESGETLLTLEERWFVYEIVWLLNKVGHTTTYNYLSNDWEKVFGSVNIRKKILFESPLMSKTREKFLVDMEIYRNKTDVEMGEPCRKCRSESTISVTSQTRSADEAATIKISCLSCGHKWTAQ